MANSPPVFASTILPDNRTVYVEGKDGVIIDATLTVTDPNLTNGNYAGATLTVVRQSPIPTEAEDVFLASGNLGNMFAGQALTLSGVVIGQVQDSPLGTRKILFNENATQARVNEVLHSITYLNVSGTPPASVTIAWTLDDGNTGAQGTGGAKTGSFTSTIEIHSVNSAPSGLAGDFVVFSGNPAQLHASDFRFYDPEDGNVLTAVRIDALPASGIVRFKGAELVPGQLVTAAELAAGQLTYQATDNSAPYLKFTVMDSGGLFDFMPSMLNLKLYRAFMLGTSDADSFVGTDLDETMQGMGGDDLLIGNKGCDTAIFSGARANYTVSNAATAVIVNDLRGTDGRDTLYSIERIHFSDVNLAFDVNGAGGQAYRLYQAAFDREPDTGGLGFYIKVMDQGMGVNTVAQYFVQSPEFLALYGTQPSNADLVNRYYHNVLHREPDTAGYQFWLNLLDTHQINTGQALAYFSESPENQAALVGVISAGVAYLPYP